MPTPINNTVRSAQAAITVTYQLSIANCQLRVGPNRERYLPDINTLGDGLIRSVITVSIAVTHGEFVHTLAR